MATGESVVGLKYNGGAFVLCDTLLNWGTLRMCPNVPRAKFVGKYTSIIASGDYGDFQSLAAELQELVASEAMQHDGIEMTPREIFTYIQRTLYGRRSEFDPLLCQVVVIGHRNNESFLGVVTDIGTCWEETAVGTGFAEHMVVPLLRAACDSTPGGLSREQALAVLQDAARALFYHDKQSMNRFQLVEATGNKVTISEPFSVETNWAFDGFKYENTSHARLQPV